MVVEAIESSEREPASAEGSSPSPLAEARDRRGPPARRRARDARNAARHGSRARSFAARRSSFARNDDDVDGLGASFQMEMAASEFLAFRSWRKKLKVGAVVGPAVPRV